MFKATKSTNNVFFVCPMKRRFLTWLDAYLHEAYAWYLQTPERSLDQAYKAALMIKALEDEHFGGQKISPATRDYGDSVMSYFVADLKKYLKNARLRLAEFKASRYLMGLAEQDMNKTRLASQENPNQAVALQAREDPSVIIEKLNFVDQIIQKYKDWEDTNVSTSLVPVSQVPVTQSNQLIKVDDNEPIARETVVYEPNSSTAVGSSDTLSNKTGVLPRSIGRTFERIQQELDPRAEQQVVQNFRRSKKRTIVAVKFVLILIIVPILTQQLSKAFLVGPVVDRIREPNKNEIFLNVDFEEEAFKELQTFEEALKFKALIGQAPEIPHDQMEKQVKEKAAELAEEYRDKSDNAIKNVFADIFGLLAFCFVLVTRRRELQILKDFMDEVVYGLSDSAKAFVIILFTDMFVGFHSPHGWEVLLSGMSRHLGLAENEAFIGLFIATFPVILDTIFKYWIFRYLSRMSPSAVATFRNMNE